MSTNELNPCPLCGARDGYTMTATGNRVGLCCQACGDLLADCKGRVEDGRTARTDQAWNQAGEYAAGLMAQRDALRSDVQIERLRTAEARSMTRAETDRATELVRECEAMRSDVDRLREFLRTIRDTGMTADDAAEHAACALMSETASVPADPVESYDDAIESVRWYKRRADALQQAQKRMRDPERTMVCDILANGFLLQPEGDRYTAPPAAARAPLTPAQRHADELLAALADECRVIMTGVTSEVCNIRARSIGLVRKVKGLDKEGGAA